MRSRYILTFLVLIIIAGCPIGNKEEGNYLLRNRRVRIVITDSGLGGLSVMDDIAQKLLNSNYYKSAEIIFVNALFDAESGYNSLHKREEKVTMFNMVLSGIVKRYSPDVIVVACNTLSVLLEGNDFTGKTSIPVVGIIEPGVELIYQKLNETERSRVLIFGTETTIEEASHLRALKKLNIPEDRIIAQSCPHLQSYIEQNPSGEETEMLINYYFQEAINGLPIDTVPLLISLNCSHFGYSEKFWAAAVENSGFTLGAIINPNHALGDMLLVKGERRKISLDDIALKVVSKVEIRNAEPVAVFFEESSPMLAEAIRNYTLIPDLF